MKQINYDAVVDDAQVNNRYKASAAFRDVFAQIIEATHIYSNKDDKLLKASLLDTPLGSMLAIADEKALFLLEFVDNYGLKHKVKKLCGKLKAAIIPGTTEAINLIEKELRSYFEGSLKNFKTALNLTGTPFQDHAWSELCRIPYGETKSYAEQADSIERRSAYRAVANANGANRMSIVIPCHRIINSNGRIGGYGGGIDRKKWLIDHEQKNK